MRAYKKHNNALSTIAGLTLNIPMRDFIKEKCTRAKKYFNSNVVCVRNIFRQTMSMFNVICVWWLRHLFVTLSQLTTRLLDYYDY